MDDWAARRAIGKTKTVLCPQNDACVEDLKKKIVEKRRRGGTVPGIAEDMPFQNDGNRFLRICLVIDTFLHAVRSYRSNTRDAAASSDDDSLSLSEVDFLMCGGCPKKVSQKNATQKSVEFSLYRQLCYAEYDMKAFLERSYFPSKKSIDSARNAKSIAFSFYDTDDEVIADSRQETVRRGSKFALKRIGYVLKELHCLCRPFRKELRRKTCAKLIISHTIKYDDFVECGGHRTASKARRFSFYTHLLRAKRDCQSIFMTGRCSRERGRMGTIETNSEDFEDVEDLDDVCEDGGGSVGDHDAQDEQAHETIRTEDEEDNDEGENNQEEDDDDDEEVDDDEEEIVD